jgi:DnaK suppressor protein
VIQFKEGPMTVRNLRKCQKELVSLRSALLSKMAIFKEGTLELAEGDIADRALGTYLQEMQLSRDQRNSQELSSIEDALKRIERHTYGQCEGCGKTIGRKRLAALPWARLCLECKVAEEQT